MARRIAPMTAAMKRRRVDKPVSPRSAQHSGATGDEPGRRRCSYQAGGRYHRTPGRRLARLPVEGAPGEVRQQQGGVRTTSEQSPRERGVRTNEVSMARTIHILSRSMARAIWSKVLECADGCWRSSILSSIASQRSPWFSFKQPPLRVHVPLDHRPALC